MRAVLSRDIIMMSASAKPTCWFIHPYFSHVNENITWFTLIAFLNQWHKFSYKVLRTIFSLLPKSGGDIGMVNVPTSVCPSVCLSRCTSMQGFMPLSAKVIAQYTSNLVCTHIRWIVGNYLILSHINFLSGGQKHENGWNSVVSNHCPENLPLSAFQSCCIHLLVKSSETMFKTCYPKIFFFISHTIIWNVMLLYVFLYPPQNDVVGGILVSLRPCVCPSVRPSLRPPVCPSVPHPMSAL